MYLCDRLQVSHEYFFIRVAIAIAIIKKDEFLDIEDDVDRDEAFATLFQSGSSLDDIDGKELLAMLNDSVLKKRRIDVVVPAIAVSFLKKYSEEQLGQLDFIPNFIEQIIVLNEGVIELEDEVKHEPVSTSPIRQAFK